MKTVPEEQIRWLASTMAARMLVNAGSKERRGQMADALRDWFPDAEMTLIEQSHLAERVGEHFGKLATLLDQRLAKLAAEDPPRAVPLPGCDVIT